MTHSDTEHIYQAHNLNCECGECLELNAADLEFMRAYWDVVLDTEGELS